MYYFVNWRETPDAKVADLPEEIDYQMLAAPSASSEYALFECVIPDEYEESKAIEPVPDYLNDLLESAKDYPPALALAREEVRGSGNEPKSEFARKLIERLEFHLKEQRNSPYFLVRKFNRSSRWHSEGGFHWVVGYDAQDVLGTIAWVSHDYYLLRDSPDDFDVEVAELEERFRK